MEPPRQLKLPTPPTERRQLHQSGVDMYNKCGTQAEFRYVKGLRRPPSAYMICGNATDKAVNWDLDTKIVTGDLANMNEITDLARDAVGNDPRGEGIQLDEEDAGKSVAQVIGETKDKAVRLVRSHHSFIAPTIQPFRTARKFTVNLDKFLRARAKLIRKEAESPDLSAWRRRVMKAQARALNAAARIGVDFVGEQDIVEKFDNRVVEVMNIRDTKTTRKSKSQRDVDNSDQLTAYATSAIVVDGRLPDEVILDVLVDLKGGVKPQTLRSTRTAFDVDVYLNRVANATAGFQLGNFTPTQQSNWWCSPRYCGFTHLCPYFRSARRPTEEIVTGLDHSGSANDLLPILNKSVALAKKDDDDDAD